jgi:hypothetical protein
VFKAAQLPNILILKDNVKGVSQLVLLAQFQLITAQVAKMDKFLIKQVDSVFLRSHHLYHLLHHLLHLPTVEKDNIKRITPVKIVYWDVMIVAMVPHVINVLQDII